MSDAKAKLLGKPAPPAQSFLKEKLKAKKQRENEVLTVEQAIELGLDQTQEIEGGFVDNPSDRGGATNRGVTLKTLQSIRPGATVDDLKRLSHAEARKIFRKQYVDEPGINKLPAWLVPHMVGLSIHAGPVKAVQLLQEVAGVEADGKLGPKTAAAADKVDADKLRERIEDFYVSIVRNDPSQSQFLRGWLERIRRLHRTTGQVVTEQPAGVPPGAKRIGTVGEAYIDADGRVKVKSAK